MVQKLLYFCQGGSLAWDGRPLFPDTIEAWRDGPVCRDVYRSGGTLGDMSALGTAELTTIEAVLGFYGQKPRWWLVDLTHREEPWRAARGDISPRAHSDAPIAVDALERWFRSYGVTSKVFPAEFREAMELLADMSEDEMTPLDQETFVDAEPFTRWLATGEGEPWENSSGSAQ